MIANHETLAGADHIDASMVELPEGYVRVGDDYVWQPTPEQAKAHLDEAERLKKENEDEILADYEAHQKSQGRELMDVLTEHGIPTKYLTEKHSGLTGEVTALQEEFSGVTTEKGK